MNNNRHSKFTRWHFDFLADWIHGLPDGPTLTRKTIADELARELSAKCRAFDYETFMQRALRSK